MPWEAGDAAGGEPEPRHDVHGEADAYWLHEEAGPAVGAGEREAARRDCGVQGEAGSAAREQEVAAGDGGLHGGAGPTTRVGEREQYVRGGRLHGCMGWETARLHSGWLHGKERAEGARGVVDARGGYEERAPSEGSSVAEVAEKGNWSSSNVTW